jgi:hypothetical protein
MTITGDYTVFAIRYHPSSCAFTRPPLEVPRTGVWCGEHIRFVEESGNKPHGRPAASAKSPMARGTFKAEKKTGKVNKCGGILVGSSVREAVDAGKTVHEYCPTAVMIQEGAKRQANTWQCRCC